MPPKILESKAEVIEELCSLIKDLAACAIKERNLFTIGLSGIVRLK